MKVLYVVDGAECAAHLHREFLDAIARLGVDARVALLTRTGAAPRLGDACIPVDVLPTSRPHHDARLIAALTKTYRIDIVHSMLQTPDIAVRIACRITRTPLVSSLVDAAHARGPGTPDETTRVERRITSAFETRTARWVTAFHATSPESRQNAVKAHRVDPARVWTIPFERDLECDSSVEAGAKETAELYRLVLAGAPTRPPAPTHPAKRVHGALITYRRLDDLAASLRALCGQTVPLASLTVVDNAGDGAVDGVVADARLPFPASVVHAPTNLGPAGGFALAWKHLAPTLGHDDWLLFLDDDNPLFFPDAIERLQRITVVAESAHAPVGAVGIAGSHFNRRTGLIRRPDDEELEGILEVDYIAGNVGLMIAARAAHDAGVYDADLFYGLEELEFGLRLQRFGYHVVTDGQLFLDARRFRGRTGPSVPRRDRRVSPGRRYYAVRNHVVIMRRYGSTGGSTAVTLANVVLRPLVDLVRGRDAAALLRASAKGAYDGWTDRLGRRTPLDGGED